MTQKSDEEEVYAFSNHSVNSFFQLNMPLVLFHSFTKEVSNAFQCQTLSWKYSNEQVMISALKYFRSGFPVSVDGWGWSKVTPSREPLLSRLMVGTDKHAIYLHCNRCYKKYEMDQFVASNRIHSCYLSSKG